MIKFWSRDEYYTQKGLLDWLHNCVDENIKGAPYEHFYYSDGSASWCYKSKNHKWEITYQMDRITFRLDEQYDMLYLLKFDIK